MRDVVHAAVRMSGWRGRTARIACAFLAVANLVSSLSGGESAQRQLAGVIDLHCHTGPDVVPRSVTDLELARRAQTEGMRALVLKNHYTMTADRAQLAMLEVAGVEVFGGIVLNRSVGGINAEAVRRMTQMAGRRGKIVWLPTVDAENQVRFSKESRSFVAVVRAGQPVPELLEVFQLIAQHDLVLATGHSGAEETLVLIARAKEQGVRRILVTHVLAEALGATTEHMQEMARLNATMECTWLSHFSGAAGAINVGKILPIEACARVVQRIGAEHFVISSDFGQQGNPPPPDGLRTFMAALRTAGLTEREVDLLARRNPARLLGLEP